MMVPSIAEHCYYFVVIICSFSFQSSMRNMYGLAVSWLAAATFAEVQSYPLFVGTALRALSPWLYIPAYMNSKIHAQEEQTIQ